MTLWLVFGLYLLLLLVLGEVVARWKIASLEDYLVSGREHGTLVTAAALTATVIGAGSTLGAAGVAYYTGISAGWYLLSAVPGLVLLAFTLGPVLRRQSVYTVPEFLGNRYGRTAGLLAAALGVVGLVLFLAAQFYALGAVLDRLTPLGQRAGLITSAVVVVIYTWRGGNWVVHWSDSLQVLWIVAGVAVAVVLALAATGWEAYSRPPVAAGFEAAGARWFHPITLETVSGWNPLALGNTVSAWIIMSTTWHFAMQSTAQRIVSSRSGPTVRKGLLLAAALLVPLAAVFGLLGMSARVLYPDLTPPEAGLRVQEQVLALPTLVESLLPPVAAGLVLAALVAVVMSTCDSALLGGSTLVIRDLWPGGGGAGSARGSDPGGRRPPDDGDVAGADRRPGAREVERDDASEVGRGRTLVLALGAVALGAALVAPGLVQVLEMVAAVYCVALFVPLLVGHYWRGATEAGAVAAMLASGVTALLWRATGLEEATGLHMLNLALPVALLALVGVSMVTAAGDEAGREA